MEGRLHATAVRASLDGCPRSPSPTFQQRDAEKSLGYGHRGTLRGVPGDAARTRARGPTTDPAPRELTASLPPGSALGCSQLALPGGGPHAGTGHCRVHSPKGSAGSTSPLSSPAPRPSQLWSAGILSSDLLTSICQSVTREADQRQRLSQGQEAVRPPTNTMVSGNRGHLQTPGPGEPSETPQCQETPVSATPQESHAGHLARFLQENGHLDALWGSPVPTGGPLRLLGPQHTISSIAPHPLREGG